jgi:hypothetical protein
MHFVVAFTKSEIDEKRTQYDMESRAPSRMPLNSTKAARRTSNSETVSQKPALETGAYIRVKSPYTVLEIGTGLGYQSAIFAQLARKVYSIEIIEELGQQAQQRLRREDCTNVEFKIANGYHGWSEPRSVRQDNCNSGSGPHSCAADPSIKSWWKNGDSCRAG